MAAPGELRGQAISLHQAGQHDEALPLYARYLGLHPDDAAMWSNYGALLRLLRRYPLALAAQDRAAAIDPDNPSHRLNRANILSDIGRYEDSMALRRTLPQDAEQASMIGRCLRGQGKYAQAADHLAKAVRRYPGFHDLPLQLAFAQLGGGNYREGFRNYRARWNGPDLTPRSLDIPPWDGSDPAGRTILVLSEQGLGDTVLFARFLPLLKARGARVVLRVRKPLLRLLAGIGGADEVTADTQAGADAWVNLIDLAIPAFDQSPVIPAPAALHVPADSHSRAKGRIAPFRDTFRVGTIWSGSETYKGNGFRSFRHTDLMPLCGLDGVQLFSLYKGPLLADYLSDGSAALMVDAASDDRDLADCAATMQAMDLVITSDTATAHIAGSLGIPAWVVLHWDPFWVYGHAGDTTPWYPSMRLFRQDRPMEWGGVMARVRDALADRVEQWRRN